ncbi:MAG TPA: sulfotransferase family protein [Gammaproteobacteria bacterium]|nr:sulfotransferase family protein [Gammaproteobacteria bacterium]
MTDPLQNVEQLKKQALAYAFQNQLDEAKELLAQLISLCPRDPEPFSMLAIIHGGQGDYEKSLELSRKAVFLAPKDINAHINTGHALSSLGRLEEAIAGFTQALAISPGYPAALQGIGDAWLGLEKPDVAINYYRQALKKDPHNASAHNSLGVACLQQDRTDEAIRHFKAAIRIAPGHELSHTNLGNALKKAGLLTEAAAAYQALLRIRPDNVTAHTNLGGIYLDLGILKTAEDYYRRSLSIQPESAETHYSLGYVLSMQGVLDEASSHFKAALELEPDYENALAGLAGILQKQGEFKRAYELLSPLVERGTTNVTVAWNFSSLCDRFDRCDDAILLLEKILKRDDLPPARKRLLHFSLGRLYDKKRKYDRAFSHYQNGNKLKPVSFDPRSIINEVDRNTGFFTPQRLASLPVAQSRSNAPVFIVGMPRSGTTLVEQILASHPSVYGAGELDNIFEIASSLPERLGCQDSYPASLVSLTQTGIDEVSREYLKYLQNIGGASARVTDKMPANFLYLGLIQLAFPGSRIIHCMRNPLDTGLSIYFQDFVGAHEYAYDLGNIGIMYREYRRLMAHWRSVLTLPMLDIEYESLVTDIEHHSRRIIHFCGLEWDSRCLDFHKTRRDVTTASVRQVRKPVYSSSIGRYRYYEKHMGSLKTGLGGET